MPKKREWVLCWQTGVLPPGPLLADYKASLLARAGPSHLWPECIRWPAADGDASKADTESEETWKSGIFTSSAISTISKYASLLPLSTPVPNEPELTALMQLVARRKLQHCNGDALNSWL